MYKEEWQEVIDNCEATIKNCEKTIEINKAMEAAAGVEQMDAKPKPTLPKLKKDAL